jgi:uncharacterized membrane-anchored protein
LIAFAGDPNDSTKKALLDEIKRMDSIEKALHYRSGKIVLANNVATIDVPKGFKFLDSAEARYVIEDIWGNPSGAGVLGLLFPENSGATDDGGYAFVVEYDPIGYVKDHDADKINYDDLLKELKKSSDEDNVERRKEGLFTMDLIGWAEKPFYDKEKKVLHWAKEFKVEGRQDNTLNYDIRVLGRKGVLILEAVSGMSVLDSVNRNINTVLGMVSFNEGNKYSDFDSKTDHIAAWTIGGLVAGKILAKVGFFAVILKFLKFIVLGVVAAGGGIWRFITGRRKKDQELAYEAPTSTDQPTDPQ